MDAKSRANFINSVANGASVPCPNCGAANKSNSTFCTFCGTRLIAPKPAAPAVVPETAEQPKAAPAFEPQPEEAKVTPAPAFEPQPDEQPKAAPAFEPQPAEQPKPAAPAFEPHPDEQPKAAPAFAQHTEEAPKPAVQKPAVQKPAVPAFHYQEPNTVFAEGLPAWSIEPPQIMVRRH